MFFRSFLHEVNTSTALSNASMSRYSATLAIALLSIFKDSIAIFKDCSFILTSISPLHFAVNAFRKSVYHFLARKISDYNYQYYVSDKLRYYILHLSLSSFMACATSGALNIALPATITFPPDLTTSATL